MAFDVAALWQSGYTWLAFILLNVHSNAAIACLPNLKRQLLIFTDTEVVPSLLNAMDDGRLEELVQMYRKAVTSVEQVSSLEHFL